MDNIMTNEAHKKLMQAEIRTALDTISSLGETANVTSTYEAINEDLAWNELLDRLFEEVADFATANGYEVEG